MEGVVEWPLVKNGIYVASVTVGETTTKYDTLADAFAAANAASGSTLKLLNDINVTNDDLNGVTDTPPYLVTGNFTLDLNGKTIEYTGTSTLTTGVIGVKRGGDLTVKDSSNPSTGEINSGSKAYAAIAVTVKGEAATGADAKLTVNSGTLTGNYYAVTGNGNRHGTNITVSGGNLEGTNGSAIYQPQNGTLTISGGTLKGGETGIEVRSGTLNVTGGTFETTATTYSCNPNGSGTTTVGAAIAIAQHTTNQQITASITGGTFVTPDGSDAIPLSIQNPQNNTFDNVTVSSAILELVEGSEIPEGYCWAANADGTYSLEKGKLMITKTVGDNIKDIYYASLETAVADVADGETIELLANVTMAGHAVAAKLTTAGQSFQINFGNFDVTNISGGNTYSVKLAKGVMAKTSKATDIFNVKDDVTDAQIVSGPTHAQTGHYAYYAATTTTGVSYIDAAGNEDKFRAAMERGAYRSDKRESRRDHRPCLVNAKFRHQKIDCRRSARHRDGVLAARKLREPAFELVDLRTARRDIPGVERAPCRRALRRAYERRREEYPPIRIRHACLQSPPSCTTST